jgi:hypothetical protein
VNVGRIRNFLLKHPKPKSVRVTTVEGSTEVLDPGNSWARCAETVHALGVRLVECLDGNGNIIRAKNFDGEDAARSEAAPIPTAIANDPNAAMMMMFANLLHRAYEHSTEVAFQKLVEMFEHMTSRTEAIENRLARAEVSRERLRDQQIEQAFERAAEIAERASATPEEKEDLLSQMLRAFMGGMGGLPVEPSAAAAAAPSSAPAPANGASSPRPRKPPSNGGSNGKGN